MNIGKIFSDINCTNVFLGQSPKAIEIKTKKEKKTKKETKRQHSEWEKYICEWNNLQGLNLQNIQTAHIVQNQKNKQHDQKWACTLGHFSCVWLCDPMDCNLPGSSVHGILQARRLEWVAMPSSRGSSQPRDWTHVYYVSCIDRWVLYH